MQEHRTGDGIEAAILKLHILDGALDEFHPQLLLDRAPMCELQARLAQIDPDHLSVWNLLSAAP